MLDKEEGGAVGWRNLTRFDRYCQLAVCNDALQLTGGVLGSSALPEVTLPQCCTAGCLLHNPHTVVRARAATDGQASSSSGTIATPLEAPPAAKLMRLCKAQSTKPQWAVVKKLLARGCVHLATAQTVRGGEGQPLLHVRAHVTLHKELSHLDPCSCVGCAALGCRAAAVSSSMASWPQPTAKPTCPHVPPPLQPTERFCAAGAPVLDTWTPVSTATTSTAILVTAQDAPPGEEDPAAAGAPAAGNVSTGAAGAGPSGAAGAHRAGSSGALAAAGETARGPSTTTTTAPAAPTDPAARMYCVELVMEPGSFTVVSSSSSCCGAGWDPLRNCPCALVTAVRLQVALSPDLVLCEHDVRTLVSQLQATTLGNMVFQGIQTGGITPGPAAPGATGASGSGAPAAVPVTGAAAKSAELLRLLVSVAQGALRSAPEVLCSIVWDVMAPMKMSPAPQAVSSKLLCPPVDSALLLNDPGLLVSSREALRQLSGSGEGDNAGGGGQGLAAGPRRGEGVLEPMDAEMERLRELIEMEGGDPDRFGLPPPRREEPAAGGRAGAGAARAAAHVQRGAAANRGSLPVLWLGPWEPVKGKPAWLREDYAMTITTERYRSDWYPEGVSLHTVTLSDYLAHNAATRSAFEGWSETVSLLATYPDATKPSDSQRQMDEIVRVMQVLVEARRPHDPLNTVALDRRIAYPNCVWRVFDALACAACIRQVAPSPAAVASLGHLEVGAALSELLRVLWHCMHRWDLDDEMSRRVKTVVEGLGRILLCCHVPGPMRMAMHCRLQLWRAKLSESILRMQNSNRGYGGSYGGSLETLKTLNALTKAMLLCESVAVTGWDDPQLTAALASHILAPTAPTALITGSQPWQCASAGGAGGSDAVGGAASDAASRVGLAKKVPLPQPVVLLDVPSRLAWLDKCQLLDEYVSLACAAGEWASAVRKLVLMGGKAHVSLATQLTVELVKSPQEKAVLACGLVAAAVHQRTKLLKEQKQKNKGPGSEQEEDKVSPLTFALDTAQASLTAEEFEAARKELLGLLSPYFDNDGARECCVILMDMPSEPKPFRNSVTTNEQSTGTALAAALMEAAPELPVTFIASCACAMFLSAARTLLSLNTQDSNFKSEMDALGNVSETTNPWLSTIRQVFNLLALYTEEQSLEGGPSAGAEPASTGALSSEGNKSVAALSDLASATPSGPGQTVPASTQDPGPLLVKGAHLILKHNPQEGKRYLDVLFQSCSQGKLSPAPTALRLDLPNGPNPDQELRDQIRRLGSIIQQMTVTQALGGASRSLRDSPVVAYLNSLTNYMGWNTGFGSVAATLAVEQGGFITDGTSRSQLASVIDVDYSNTASLRSLAHCVVRSMLDSNREALIQDSVRKAEELRGMVDTAESLVTLCRDALLPDSVQLQAVAEAMCVTLMCVSSQAKRQLPTLRRAGPGTTQDTTLDATTRAAVVTGRLAPDLAKQGCLRLALQLGKSHFKQSRSPESAAKLFELAVVSGEEEQEEALRALFEPLWNRDALPSRYRGGGPGGGGPGGGGPGGRGYGGFGPGRGPFRYNYGPMEMFEDMMMMAGGPDYDDYASEDFYSDMSDEDMMDGDPYDYMEDYYAPRPGRYRRYPMLDGPFVFGRGNPYGPYPEDLDPEDWGSDEYEESDTPSTEEMEAPEDARRRERELFAEAMQAALRAGMDPAAHELVPELIRQALEAGEAARHAIAHRGVPRPLGEGRVAPAAPPAAGAPGAPAAAPAVAEPMVIDMALEDSEGEGQEAVAAAAAEGQDTAVGLVGRKRRRTAGGGDDSDDKDDANDAGAGGGDRPTDGRSADSLSLRDTMFRAAGLTPPPAEGNRGDGAGPSNRPAPEDEGGPAGRARKRQRAASDAGPSGSVPPAPVVAPASPSNSCDTEDLLADAVRGELLPEQLRQQQRVATPAAGADEVEGGAPAARAGSRAMSEDVGMTDAAAGPSHAAPGEGDLGRRSKRRSHSRKGRPGGGGGDDGGGGGGGGSNGSAWSNGAADPDGKGYSFILRHIKDASRLQLSGLLPLSRIEGPGSGCLTSPEAALFALAQYLKGRGAGATILKPLMAAAVKAFEHHKDYSVSMYHMNGDGGVTTLKPSAACASWRDFLGDLGVHSVAPRPLPVGGRGRQQLGLKGFPAATWSEFLAERVKRHTDAPVYSALRDEHTAGRLEVMVAWVEAACADTALPASTAAHTGGAAAAPAGPGSSSAPQPAVAPAAPAPGLTLKEEVLLAMASVVDRLYGCCLAHLGYALLRCPSAEAQDKGLDLISRATLPCIGRYHCLSQQHYASTPAMYYTSPLYHSLYTRIGVTLAQRLATLDPPLDSQELGSNFDVGPMPSSNRRLLTASVLHNVARTLVFMQVSFPPELLSCPVAVRSAMSLFNDLMITRCRARDMDLFTERPANPTADVGYLSEWLPIAFQKVLMGPLRSCDEGVQQAFMETAGGMGDDLLDFKLKVPLLEWVGSARLPVSSVLQAANKALKETVATLKSALLGSGVSATARQCTTSWLQDKQASLTDWETKAAAAAYLGTAAPPLPGPAQKDAAAVNPEGDAAGSSRVLGPTSSSITGQRKWLGYVLKWLTTKLVTALEDTPVALLVSATGKLPTPGTPGTVPAGPSVAGTSSSAGPVRRQDSKASAQIAADSIMALFQHEQRARAEAGDPAVMTPSPVAAEIAFNVMKLSTAAGQTAQAGGHPLHLLAGLVSAVRGYDGPELMHLGLALLEVLDLYVRAFSKVGIVFDSLPVPRAGVTGIEPWTLTQQSKVAFPLSLMMASLMLPELGTVKWGAEEPSAPAAAQRNPAQSYDIGLARQASGPQVQLPPGLLLPQVNIFGLPLLLQQPAALTAAAGPSQPTRAGSRGTSQSGAAPLGMPALGGALGAAAPIMASGDALAALAHHTTVYARGLEQAISSLYGEALALLLRSVLPHCGAWATLSGSDVWASAEYRSYLWRLLRSQAPLEPSALPALAPVTAQDAASSQSKPATLPLQRPLPPALLRNVSVTLLHTFCTMEEFVEITGLWFIKGCGSLQDSMQLALPTTCLSTTIKHRHLPPLLAAQAAHLVDCLTPSGLGVAHCLQVPTALSLHLSQAHLAPAQEVSLFLRLQVHVAAMTTCTETELLTHALQQPKGLTLAKAVTMWRDVLGLLKDPRNLSPGLRQVLGPAVVLNHLWSMMNDKPRFPEPNTMTVAQVHTAWARATQQANIGGTMIPPVLRRAALLLRLQSSITLLEEVVVHNNQTQPHMGGYQPYHEHHDPAVAAAHSSACEMLSQEVWDLFCLDRLACAVVLGIPGIALSDQLQPEVSSTYVSPDAMVREARSRGFPGTSLQPHVIQGPLLESRRLLDLGRFTVLTRHLGQRCRAEPAFLRVYRAFRGSPPPLENKITRYIQRTPGLTVEQLAARLGSTYTAQAIDDLKTQHLPWAPEITTGNKVNRARELAAFVLNHRKEYRL